MNSKSLATTQRALAQRVSRPLLRRVLDRRSLLGAALFASVALPALFAGCGGNHGTLALTVVVSPVDDPFIDAKTVRLTVGDASHQKLFPVTGGHFSASIDLSPLSTPGPVRLDLLDGNSNEIAYGQTTVLSLQPYDQAASIWVGRPGHIVPAVAALPSPTTDLTATSIEGVGILFAGGRTGGGVVSTDAEIYLTLLQTMFPATALSNARANAVAATIGEEAVVFGGATDSFFEGMASPLPDAEIFDPTSGQAGVWSGVPGDPVPARSSPQLTALAGGDFLISGGYDGNGARMGTAAFIAVSATTALQNVSMSMVVPRGGHTACPAAFADGNGALLMGGADSDDPSMVAERLLGQSFTSVTLTGVENRIDATCTTLQSGKILLLGGTIDGTPTQTGFIIDPSAATATTPPTVTALPTALSTPRARHTATLMNNGQVLVCGGTAAGHLPIASCDVIDGNNYTTVRTVPLTTPRRDHVASMLDTGQVLIAGGLSASSAPLASIEIYTP